jgi:hypothetical protein
LRLSASIEVSRLENPSVDSPIVLGLARIAGTLAAAFLGGRGAVASARVTGGGLDDVCIRLSERNRVERAGITSG